MTLRCNICSTEIDEADVESHIISQIHLENKSKTSTIGKGQGDSVANLWHNSLRQ
jgi:hypothetical protein